jgi:phage repressor protein C with HTH and peptisase S24 domain
MSSTVSIDKVKVKQMLIYQMLKVRDNIRMNMYQHRRERLLALIDAEYGGERVRFADKTGLSESRLAQLLSTTYRDGTAFTEKTARKVEDAAGLPMMYFDQGATLPQAELPLTGDFKRVRAVDADDPNMTQIMKVKLKVRAGITGFQTEPEDYEGETQGVPTAWVYREGFHPEALLSIVVRGDSMEPALYEGDVIVVNTLDKTMVSGLVYVVNYEGEAVVKRMIRDAGQWWLTSDNPDQRRYHRQLCKGAECIVIGKVVRKESTHI